MHEVDWSHAKVTFVLIRKLITNEVIQWRFDGVLKNFSNRLRKRPWNFSTSFSDTFRVNDDQSMTWLLKKASIRVLQFFLNVSYHLETQWNNLQPIRHSGRNCKPCGHAVTSQDDLNLGWSLSPLDLPEHPEWNESLDTSNGMKDWTLLMKSHINVGRERKLFSCQYCINVRRL